MTSLIFSFAPWYVWVGGLLGLVALTYLGLWPLVIGFLRNVPWPVYAMTALVLVHLALVHLRVTQAIDETNATWTAKLAAEKAAYEKQVTELKAKQQQVVTRTVIEYRDRIKIVKEKGDEIVREVQVLVPADSPLLAGGVRVAHDAAASGHLPDDPAGAAAAAESVEAAALLTTVAENYQSCRADAERLIALQGLVSSLEGVKSP